MSVNLNLINAKGECKEEEFYEDLNQLILEMVHSNDNIIFHLQYLFIYSLCLYFLKHQFIIHLIKVQLE